MAAASASPIRSSAVVPTHSCPVRVAAVTFSFVHFLCRSHYIQYIGNIGFHPRSRGGGRRLANGYSGEGPRVVRVMYYVAVGETKMRLNRRPQQGFMPSRSPMCGRTV